MRRRPGARRPARRPRRGDRRARRLTGRPSAPRRGGDAAARASAQLAVAVQNARLHEREGARRRARAPAGLRARHGAAAARPLRDLGRVRRSLSLDATLEAVARTMVEVFELAAAAIRMPAPGRARATSCGRSTSPSRRSKARCAAILGAARRPRRLLGRSSRRAPRAVSSRSRRPGGARHADAGPARPGRPLDADDDRGRALVAGAGRAGARQRPALPAAEGVRRDDAALAAAARAPAVDGLDVGHVYESSARVEVGGDVYDFLRARGRPARGRARRRDRARASMPPPTWRWRSSCSASLAREQPEPADFLAHANEVVVEEIAAGKFVTMVYRVVDPARARSPAPARATRRRGSSRADGSVDGARRVAGSRSGSSRARSTRRARDALEPGDAVVLYTDGVVEARRDGGALRRGAARRVARRERRALARRSWPTRVLADCRAFAGGELADDCAVVCVKLAR